MADHTKIEWTEATWNPITGCSVATPGCTNCYAMKLAGTRLAHHPSRAGLTRDTKVGPVWTGEVRFNEQWLTQPLQWKRPRMIFVCAHGDLFHESVPDEWIDRVFAVMALAPQHTFQVLTKRAKRMRGYFAGCDGSTEWVGDSLQTSWQRRDGVRRAMTDLWAAAGYKDGLVGKVRKLPLPNVWLGVSVEDQTRADERIPDLLATPAAVRWLSCEPLLGPVDLTHIKMVDYITEGGGSVQGWESALNGRRFDEWSDGDSEGWPKLDWIVAGGESGPSARPMANEWAQSLVDQCKAAGVPVFVKQLSSGGPKAIKDIDAFPEGLRVREYPA